MDYDFAGIATLRMPVFKGLMQSGDGIGADPCCAVECVNALTRRGVLSPMARCELLPAALPAPIETLARLHEALAAPRRNRAGRAHCIGRRQAVPNAPLR